MSKSSHGSDVSSKSEESKTPSVKAKPEVAKETVPAVPEQPKVEPKKDPVKETPAVFSTGTSLAAAPKKKLKAPRKSEAPKPEVPAAKAPEKPGFVFQVDPKLAEQLKAAKVGRSTFGYTYFGDEKLGEKEYAPLLKDIEHTCWERFFSRGVVCSSENIINHHKGDVVVKHSILEKVLDFLRDFADDRKIFFIFYEKNLEVEGKNPQRDLWLKSLALGQTHHQTRRVSKYVAKFRQGKSYVSYDALKKADGWGYSQAVKVLKKIGSEFKKVQSGPTLSFAKPSSSASSTESGGVKKKVSSAHMKAEIEKAVAMERKKIAAEQRAALALPKPTNPAVRPPVQYENIASWLKSKPIPVCQADSQVLAFAKQVGIEVKPNPDTTLNPHSISALYREYAMKTFLSIVGRDKKSLRLLSFFGANRDRRYTPKSSTGCSIEWVCAPNTPIQGDNARDFSTRIPMPDDKVYDGVIIVDVYQSGNDFNTSLSPSTIKDLITGCTSGFVYAILRNFIGDCGADVFRIEEGGGKCSSKVEGVWHRLNGLCHFSPDNTAGCYAGHPTPDWINNRSYDGLDIHDVKAFGPYHLYKFALTSSMAQPLGPSRTIDPLVSTVSLQKSVMDSLEGRLSYYPSVVLETLRSWVPSSVLAYFPEAGKITLLMHNRAYANLSSFYQTKKITGLLYEAVAQKVQSEFDRDSQILAVRERFPMFYNMLLRGTAICVMHYKKEEQLNTMFDARVLDVKSEQVVSEMRGGGMKDKSITGKLFWLLSLAGFIYVLYKIRGRNTVAGNLFAIMRPGAVDLVKTIDTSAVSDPIEKGVLETLNKDIRLRRNETCLDFLQNLASIPRTLSMAHTMFIGPAYEEAIKVFAPKIGLLLCAMEAFVNAKVNGREQAALVFCMHLFTMLVNQKSWFLAFLIHSAWNTCATTFNHGVCATVYKSNDHVAIMAAARLLEYLKPGCFLYYWVQWKNLKTLSYTDFLNSYIHKEKFDAPPFGQAIKPQKIPAVQTEIYPDFPARGVMKCEYLGLNDIVDIKKVIVQDDDVEEKAHGIYPLLINNGLMYTPANSQNNLLASLLLRIHKEPFGMCPPHSKRLLNWSELMRFPLVTQILAYYKTFSLRPSDWNTMEEIVKIMGSKGKRIEACYERMLSGEEMPPKKSYNVKWNETIPLRPYGLAWDIKPRSICNLDPSIHVLTTQIARYITNVFHRVFDGRHPFQCAYGELRIHFASGYTQQKLSEMWEDFMSFPNFLAVAGDDSMYKVTIDGVEECGEGDFSMYDQSQDDGPLVVAPAYWMVEIGIDSWVIDFLSYVYSKGYKVAKRNSRDLEVTGTGGVQLPTGVTLTTVMNSVNDVYAFTKAFSLQPFDFETHAASLGFTVKLRKHGQSFEKVSFLKGWWVKEKYSESRVWMPLPSAVLKLGKFLKPLDFFGHNPVGTCCFMTSQSYFGIDRNYPIFGDFLAVMDKFSIQSSYGGDVNENEFKPKMDLEVKIDFLESCDQIMDRYGFTLDSISEMRRLYREVRSLPWFINHPAFEVMQQVDYC